jgi:ribosome-associated translation inhibitor RaiA
MQIRWSQMHELRPSAQRAAEQRLEALNAAQADLIDVRIASHHEGNHRRGGRGVHINALLRGHRLAASREGDEIELALTEALDAFEREVHDLRRRRRDRRVERSAPLAGSYRFL